jgi:hypothetical protein
MRHFFDEGVDPFEVRRRIGRVHVEALSVLDLTDSSVRDAVGLSEADLLGDFYTATQTVAAAALGAGFDGLLAPSAALPGRRTLVVFAAAMSHVTSELSRVRQPPPRLADLLRLIRPHRDAPAGVRDYLRALATAGSAAIRALRRR